MREDAHDPRSLRCQTGGFAMGWKDGMAVLVATLLIGGCVSTRSHKQILAELDETRVAVEAANKRNVDLGAAHQAISAKLTAVMEELTATRQRIEQLTNELATATREGTHSKQENEATVAALREAEQTLEKLRQERQQLRQQLTQEQVDKES